MEIIMNLLRTEPYDDGNRRFIGMYQTVSEGILRGGPEAIYTTPEKMFDALRKMYGEKTEISVKSEKLSQELEESHWFRGRTPIEEPELTEIVNEQKKGGHKVELVA